MRMLTEIQALKVATEFLEDRRKRTGGETPLDLVIGDMYIISSDGREVETSDPAILGDWEDAVDKVLKDEKMVK